MMFMYTFQAIIAMLKIFWVWSGEGTKYYDINPLYKFQLKIGESDESKCVIIIVKELCKKYIV